MGHQIDTELRFSYHKFSLRNQPTLRDATSDFPILMTSHCPDLDSVSDWSCQEGNLLQPIRSTTPDLGSDTSSVWNFCARSSDVISPAKAKIEKESVTHLILHIICCCYSTVTVTSPVQSEADQGELTLVPPPKEPDQILQPLSQPKTIRLDRLSLQTPNTCLV